MLIPPASCASLSFAVGGALATLRLGVIGDCDERCGFVARQ